MSSLNKTLGEHSAASGQITSVDSWHTSPAWALENSVMSGHGEIDLKQYADSQIHMLNFDKEEQCASHCTGPILIFGRQATGKPAPGQDL